MPSAYDHTPKPKPTPRDQLRSVAGRPQTVAWAAGIAGVLLVLLVASASLHDALRGLSLVLVGSGVTWLAGKAR